MQEPTIITVKHGPEFVAMEMEFCEGERKEIKW